MTRINEAKALQYRLEDSPKRRQSTPQAVINARAVLCIGYNAETLKQRSELLNQAGYDVACAANREGALTLLRQRPFPALVVGHAVPENDRLEFIEAARALNPDAIVVLLYWDSIRRAEKADAILCIGNGPTGLVQALRDLIGR